MVPLIGAALIAVGVAAWLGWRAMNARPQTPLEAAVLTTFSGVEHYPSLSPDGSYVAFTWNGPQRNNEDVFVQLIGSGLPLRLTSDPKSDGNPRAIGTERIRGR